jgi:hypothetical protein
MFVRLQSTAVNANHIEGGKHLDSGAFGNIEKALFHGSKVAVKYVKPSAGKVLALQLLAVEIRDVYRLLTL